MPRAPACQQAAAAYKVVVPTSQPELVCGETPTLGAVSEVFLMTGAAKNDLPPRENVIQQCVRLAACKARGDGKLEWDAQRMRFANNPEANKYLRPTFRRGWKFVG